jgi:hypothetical protein
LADRHYIPAQRDRWAEGIRGMAQWGIGNFGEFCGYYSSWGVEALEWSKFGMGTFYG